MITNAVSALAGRFLVATALCSVAFSPIALAAQEAEVQSAQAPAPAANPLGLPENFSLLGDANPVRTGGPMQVDVRFAEGWVDRHGYPYAPHAMKN